MEYTSDQVSLCRPVRTTTKAEPVERDSRSGPGGLQQSLTRRVRALRAQFRRNEYEIDARRVAEAMLRRGWARENCA